MATSLILDIQSSSVRGMLVTGKKIIFELGIDIPDRVSKESKPLTRNTIEAVKFIVEGVVKDFILRRDTTDKKIRIPSIDAIHCVISSPWIISQAQIVSTSFDKEKKVTEKIVETLLKVEKAKPTLHVTKDGNRTGQLITIEKKVFSVLLNGYHVNDWQGKSAKTIDVSFVTSSASKSFIDELEEICKRVTTVKNITYHSSIILHYIASVGLAQNAAAHVCVHVHNEITDVVSIDKLGKIFFASYPVGFKTIVKRLSQSMGIKDSTASSMLSLYSEMALDPTHARNIGKLIEKIMAGWAHDYHEFLKVGGIPSKSHIHVFVSSEKYPKLFAKFMRLPGSLAKIEPITENIYPEAINSLA